MKKEKTPRPAYPCDACEDNRNGRRQWGICNGGLGICAACMDYHDSTRNRQPNPYEHETAIDGR